tara:strand:- start:29 stop:217 length:189 start_codon:yes stop_codon:yes gene_type:complete
MDERIMKKFKVTFTDVFEAETEEDCHEQLFEYLRSVLHFEDVTAFGFEEAYKPKKIRRLNER